MPKFEIGGRQEWREQRTPRSSREQRESVKSSREKKSRNWKKIVRVSAAIFLIMVMIAGVNAWFTRTTWDEYHLNPEESLTKQFDYVEVYPSMAQDFGPILQKGKWGTYGNYPTGRTAATQAEWSCVNSIEVPSIAADNKEDRYESVLWYGMEYRDGDWVMTASTYKPFKDGEMRLLECYTRDGMTQRIVEVDKK